MKRLISIIATVFLVTVMSLASASAAQKIILVNKPAQWHKEVKPEKFPSEVLRLVNLERAKVGASPLKFADDLAASALVRARELPFKFSHTRPNGSKCFTAMAQIGHILGENLAGGQTTPKQVVQAWMDSKSHRDNILSKQFKEIGIVYYYQSNSKFKHYWVQHFRG